MLDTVTVEEKKQEDIRKYGIQQSFQFPFEKLTELQSHFKEDKREAWKDRDFSHREIALVLPGNIQRRHNCQMTAEDWKKDVLKSKPERMEAGTIYKELPSEKRVRGSEFKNVPKYREIVIDLDMDCQDGQRTCCKDKKVCKKCWKFIQGGCQQLEWSLKEVWGFEHFFQVFSGRRGCHLWIFDHVARRLDDRNRDAFAEYYNFSAQALDANGGVLHPDFEYATEMLQPLFKKVVVEQLIFTHPKQENLICHITERETKNKIKRKIDTILKEYELKTDEGFTQEVTDQWANTEMADSDELVGRMKTANKEIVAAIFEEITEQENSFEAKESKKKGKVKVHIRAELVLSMLWPKLDADVTKRLDHLLKFPFCVHPNSRKVSVPLFSLEEVKEFDPNESVTLEMLVDAIQPKIASLKANGGDINVYADTPLDDTIKNLDQFKVRYKRYQGEEAMEGRKEHQRDQVIADKNDPLNMI